MAQKATFPFVEKEGKFFAPVVGKETKRSIDSDGNITSRSIPKSGVKGVYSMIRLRLPMDVAAERAELYAINTETFRSSN